MGVRREGRNSKAAAEQKSNTEARMQLGNSYVRTISDEEARRGYFIVVKDRLSFFPVAGMPFELYHGSTVRQAKVESYHCECRGHEKPHDHYFVRFNGLRSGDRIVVRRDPRYPTRYWITVNSAVAQETLCG
jgi:hypothetical protein